MSPACPSRIHGNLEISTHEGTVFIGGDPNGLRSLARLLVWLADADQESHSTMPDGEREHVHIYPQRAGGPHESLTRFSVDTELCRLDAKGTGEFPTKYHVAGKSKRK